MKKSYLWRKMTSGLMAAAVTVTAMPGLGLTMVQAEEKKTLKVAMECSYAPYNWTQPDDSNGAVPISGSSDYAYGYDVMMAKKICDELGYDLEIVEYTDYVQPNNALESGDLDANYFQHKPYLDTFNEENGTHLVSAGAIHYEPFGIYAGKSDSLDELADGAEVLVPNDVTNEARALLLLQDQGLLTLKEDAGLTATINDITENPKNLDIVELEAAQLPRSLQDADIAVINGNYAIEAGLKVTDALAVEASDSLAAQTYGNVVAVREGDEESDKTKALMEVLTSDDIKEFIETKYDGAVVPLF